MRPPLIAGEVDELQNGINFSVTPPATKGFRGRSGCSRYEGSLRGACRERLTDRCSQSLNRDLLAPFSVRPFWILLASCCCGGPRATGPGLFLSVKPQISPWGLCLPPLDRTVAAAIPSAPWRLHQEHTTFPRLSQSFPCH